MLNITQRTWQIFSQIWRWVQFFSYTKSMLLLIPVWYTARVGQKENTRQVSITLISIFPRRTININFLTIPRAWYVNKIVKLSASEINTKSVASVSFVLWKSDMSNLVKYNISKFSDFKGSWFLSSCTNTDALLIPYRVASIAIIFFPPNSGSHLGIEVPPSWLQVSHHCQSFITICKHNKIIWIMLIKIPVIGIFTQYPPPKKITSLFLKSK